MSKIVEGVLPIVHTPFLDNDEIDFVTLRREVDWAFAQGIDGLGTGMVSELLRLTAPERQGLAELERSIADCRATRCSDAEARRIESRLSQRLEALGIAEPWEIAPAMAAYGWSVERLEPVLATFAAAHVDPVLQWLGRGLAAQQLMEEIEVAVRRADPERPDGDVMLPDERLPLPEAIAAFTINAAYVNGLERETGSIEVGKAADLAVLDRNVFAIDPREISETKVVVTLLDGKPVHGDLP